jgi:hypothetical protein
MLFTSNPPKQDFSSLQAQAQSSSCLGQDYTSLMVVTVTVLEHSMPPGFSRVNDLLRLAGLAPNIIEAILRGDEPDGLSLEKLRKNLPVRWDEQSDEYGARDA